MRKIKWVVLNLSIFMVMYLVFFENNEGVANVLKVFIWVRFIIIGCVFFHSENRKKLRKIGTSVNLKLKILVDIAQVLILLYFGWTFLGVLKLLETSYSYLIFEVEEDINEDD